MTTDAGTHAGDVLVVALGADYDYAATPGLTVDEEFYSVVGAERMAAKIAAFTEGRAVVGVCGAPFKCPPAPSECALLLHDHLTERGVRDRCEIDVVIPFSKPVPPSPDTSEALLAAFEERGIRFVSERRVAALEPGTAVLDDGSRLDYDLFLGVPKHRAPDVVLASPLAEDDYVPVDSGTLATRFPGVYAVGDVATIGVPKAGVFSERDGARRRRADRRGAARRAGARALRRARLVLHRVRRRPSRPRRRRLLLRPEADGNVRRALRRARRREGALRLEPHGPLVQLERVEQLARPRSRRDVALGLVDRKRGRRGFARLARLADERERARVPRVCACLEVVHVDRRQRVRLRARLSRSPSAYPPPLCDQEALECVHADDVREIVVLMESRTAVHHCSRLVVRAARGEHIRELERQRFRGSSSLPSRASSSIPSRSRGLRDVRSASP